MEVQLLKQVRSGIGRPMDEDTYLRRVVMLPFVPFKGLELFDHKDFYAEITCVKYHIPSKIFVCWTPLDDRLSRYYHPDSLEPRCTRPIAELVAEWEAKGWQQLSYAAVKEMV